MRLFFDHTGPLVRYSSGTLEIADLNPDIETRWRLSRWEVFKLGVKAIVAAVIA